MTTTFARRAVRTALAGVVAVLVAMAGAALGAAPAIADTSRAVVIIDTGTGWSARVISFSGTISGYEALELAGASPETYGFAGQGAAICRLLGVGNDPTSSSCLGTPDDPRYWAYYRAPAGSGGWTYSRAGAGATRVSDGDVEGWRFGTGGAPAFRAFCDVAGCAPPPAAPAEPAPSGGATPVSPPGSVAAASAAAGGPTPGVVEAGDPTSTTGVGPPPTASPADAGAPAGRSRGGGARALAVRPAVVGDERGSGSPGGVLIALGLVLVITGSGVWIRRRARRVG